MKKFKDGALDCTMWRTWKTKNYVALCEELALEETKKLPSEDCVTELSSYTLHL
jgi:hypothetical protein